jgi:hypothetical protein
VSARELAAVGIAAVIHKAAAQIKTGGEAIETQTTEQQEKLIAVGNFASMISSTRKKNVKMRRIFFKQRSVMIPWHVANACGMQTPHLFQKFTRSAARA